MNYAVILRRVGELLGLLTVAQVIPLAWSLYLGSPDAAAFAVSMGIGSALALALRLSVRGDGEAGLREALVVVAVGWLLAGVAGSIPFMVSGTTTSWVDAVFEAVSGLTTTGATVFPAVGQQPPGILMWRSVLQWLGGLGITVLFIAVFPALGVGGAHLLAAEMPGPTVAKLRPRLRATARLLWTVYAGLTALQTGLLWAAGLSPYEALLHAFATLSTGGFSNRSLNIASYSSPLIEGIVILFMFLGGMNLALLYRVFQLKEWRRLRSTELKGYLLIIALATGLMTVNLWNTGTYPGFGDALRHAAFQAVALVTTTGFSSADYDAWPAASRAIALLLLFCGGMAGSTAGGIKVIRLVVLAKHAWGSLTALLHPHATLTLMVDGKPLSAGVLRGIVQFVVLYVGLFAASVVVLSFDGHDLVTTVSAAIAMLGNTGSGLGLVGPYDSYGFFSPWAKLYMTGLMIAGRLEVITVIALLSPSFWRR